MTTTVIFDFDGTIADTLEPMLEAVNAELAKRGLDTVPSDPAYRDKTLQEILAQLGIPRSRLPLLVRAVKKRFAAEAHKAGPFPGMEDAVADLSSEHHVMLLTSNTKKAVAKIIDPSRFDDVVTDSALLGKQHSLRRLLRKHKLAAENVVYVGDEVRDVEACKRAGVAMIAVSWGYNSREALRRAGAPLIVESPRQLVEVIRSEARPPA